MGKGAKHRVSAGNMVPVECSCPLNRRGERPHGQHFVRPERLKPGGDLWGRVRVIMEGTPAERRSRKRMVEVTTGSTLAAVEGRA